MIRCVHPPSCSHTVRSSKKQASVFQSSILPPSLRGSLNSPRESSTTDLASPGRAEPMQLASPKGNSNGEKQGGKIKSRELSSRSYSPYPRTPRRKPESFRAASTSPIPSSFSLRSRTNPAPASPPPRSGQSNIRPQVATPGNLRVTPRESPSTFLATPRRSEELGLS